jgi:hypothetical protein
VSQPLKQPAGVAPPATGAKSWYLLAYSSSVAKAWDSIIARDPNSALRAYTYLRDHPVQPYPGRCFPLRGKANKRVWQYEINGADRIRYQHDGDTVLVLYVGDYHP